MTRQEKIRQCSGCGCDIPMSKEMADVIDRSIAAPLLCRKCAKVVSNAN